MHNLDACCRGAHWSFKGHVSSKSNRPGDCCMCSSLTFPAARSHACSPPRQVHRCCLVLLCTVQWTCLSLDDCTRPVVLQDLAWCSASAFCKPRLKPQCLCSALWWQCLHGACSAIVRCLRRGHASGTMHFLLCNGAFVMVPYNTTLVQFILWSGNKWWDHAPGSCIGSSSCCQVTT